MNVQLDIYFLSYVIRMYYDKARHVNTNFVAVH